MSAMESMMTGEYQKNFMNNDGRRICPVCRSEETMHDRHQADMANSLESLWECEACGAEWLERYKFIELEITKDPGE